jgi:SPP1 gp7 family putative phage head morphogenesis protein
LEQVQNKVKGKVLGIYDNGDGSKDILISMPPTLLAPQFPETYEALFSASGAVYNRYDPLYIPLTQQYTSGTYPFPNILNMPTDPHGKMKLAKEVCIIEPIAGAVIDILTSLAVNGIKVEVNDSKADEFIKDFNRAVEMPKVLRWIIREYYLSGNVVPYKEVDRDGIPVGYTVLNPLAVKVKGSLLYDSEILVVDLSEEFKMLDEMDDKLRELVFRNMPSNIKQAYLKQNSEVVLPQDKISRICRNKQPYDRYAEPYLSRIFKPALIKERLRMLDLATAEGLVNQILLVRVGNDQYPVTDDEVLKRVAELFATPKPVYQVVWNHTLDAKFISREGRESLDREKYREHDEDIAKGLGVPVSLVTGEGANYSTMWVVTQSMIERVSTELTDVCLWLQKEYETICQIKGYDVKPVVRFDKTKLRQDSYVKMVLAPLYDRGLLSEQTIINEAGFDYDAELERKIAGRKNSVYFIPPTLPYTGKQLSPLQHQGREPGTPSEDYKEREPIPEPDSGPSGPPRIPASALARDWEAVELEEEYYQLFEKEYRGLEEQVLEAVEEQDSTERERKLALAYQAFLLGAFAITFTLLSKRYTDTYNDIGGEPTSLVFGEQALKLEMWHREALAKLVNDLRFALREKGYSQDAVREVFEKNAYRLKLFAGEGINKATIMGLKAGYRSRGVSELRYMAVMDEKTCPVCASHHGRVYPINLAPELPNHVNCRCWYEPV